MDDQPQPIRALNDLLFCERRCALHRLEQIWIENRHTIEGAAGHKKAHLRETRSELPGGGRVARGMWLESRRLGLIGKADVVEFPAGGPPFPIEYKRGRRRRWSNDDVQLCAQALCLEEMLDVSVPAGAIFHITSKRRREITFDAALRQKTEAAAHRLHELIASGATPVATLKPRCRGCSLREICLPDLLSQTRPTTAYSRRLYRIESSDEPD